MAASQQQATRCQLEMPQELMQAPQSPRASSNNGSVSCDVSSNSLTQSSEWDIIKPQSCNWSSNSGSREQSAQGPAANVSAASPTRAQEGLACVTSDPPGSDVFSLGCSADGFIEDEGSLGADLQGLPWLPVDSMELDAVLSQEGGIANAWMQAQAAKETGVCHDSGLTDTNISKGLEQVMSLSSFLGEAVPRFPCAVKRTPHTGLSAPSVAAGRVPFSCGAGRGARDVLALRAVPA